MSLGSPAVSRTRPSADLAALRLWLVDSSGAMGEAELQHAVDAVRAILERVDDATSPRARRLAALHDTLESHLLAVVDLRIAGLPEPRRRRLVERAEGLLLDEIDAVAIPMRA